MGLELSRFEKFKVIEVDRSQLLNAPYNPRKISGKARKKLLENVKRVGLLTPPVWNQRTGNVVSGHQRLDVLDTLQGTKEYRLKVAQVDLDEKTEKEQSLFFNNQEAQGDWDLEKLETMFADKSAVSPELAGFDLQNVYQLFGDAPNVVAIDFQAAKEKMDAVKDSLISTFRDLASKHNDRFYLIFVFDSYRTRKALTDKMGWEDGRWQNGKELLEVLKCQE